MINKIAEKTDLSKATCELVIDIFINEIKNCLVRGERFITKNFMGFEVKEYPAHKGRNPKTGEITTFPAYKSINYKTSQAFRDAINGR